MPNTTLYIGNLFFEVTDDQLKKVFSRFGAVTKSSIVYDNRGLSRGYVLYPLQLDCESNQLY
jgi:RNA recognition motif-containing protein